MGNELQIFDFENNEVRTLLVNNEPYLVGKDVADILGYANSRDALVRHVDDCDKADVVIHDGSQNRRVVVINESGLYTLIFGSKLESAKKFKRWVTSEVLPSIRQHGKYEIPKDPMSALKLMFEAQTETNAKVEVIEEQVVELTENARLDAGEYNYLSSRISERVKDIKEGLGFHFNQQQNREIYKSINSDVKKITGIDTRSQLKKKNYHDVLLLVNNRYPSPATIIRIKQLNLGGE